METIGIICFNLEDFHQWLRINHITNQRHGSHIMVGNVRYVALYNVDILRGYYFNRSYTTARATNNPHYNQIRLLYIHSIAPVKKKFKFGH